MVSIEKGSGNIYKDLGFENHDEMLLKAELVSSISDLIDAKSITQMQASDIIGLPHLTLSNMLRGDFCDISVAKMMEAISRLGREVQIVIGPEIMGGQMAAGHIEVVRH